MPKQQHCESFHYVLTSAGPKILPVEEPSCKDEESPADYNAGGYLPVKVNDSFKEGRYRVLRKLGWGHFSTVWLVKDEQLKRHSALKVVKSAGRYAETARDEIKLLSKVASFSPNHPGRSFIVSFLDSFCHQGPEASHICIVFEPLGENLLALIERNKKKGVPRPLVKVIAKQILLGLQYLHDECDLVHTDIKPENILISIPDIESHIHTELTLSPSPTSRRVGVPLPPPKSRSGVSIPVNHQRVNSTRKQVQIFDSQPLASPGRSAGLSMGHRSAGLSHSDGGSGANSVAASYNIAKMHISRLGLGISGDSGDPSHKLSVPSQPVAGPSGLSISAPRSDEPPTKGTNIAATSPSASSSSSSLNSSSSGSKSTGAASIISTPPTSLSYSLGSAVMGVMGNMTKKAIVDILPVEHAEPVGIPMKGKGKEVETSASWKDKISTSWKDRISFSISSSYNKNSRGGSSNGQSNPPSSAHRPSRHSQTGSTMSVSGSWKDPGLAAPAPAVVVPTVVNADGEEDGDYFRLAGATSASVSSTTKSESSSATVTLVRPSPSDDKPAICHPPADVLAERVVNIAFEPPSPSQIKPANGNNPSLLSQTAPRSLVSSNHQGNGSKRVTPPKVSITTFDLVPSPAAPPPTPNLASVSPTRSLPPVTSPTPSNFASAPIPVILPTNSFNPVRLNLPPISIKIADLGNATPSNKHYTEDIQTRQYRAPEAILGRKDWDARADIWSVACVIFELLTAEYLFDPQGQGQLFTKDDDHMAQIIELLGDFDLDAKMGGRYSRELFDHTGALRYIRTLKPWPLSRVMTEKYLYNETDASGVCSFLLPMLATDMRKRARARDLVDHQWLEPSPTDEIVDDW